MVFCCMAFLHEGRNKASLVRNTPRWCWNTAGEHLSPLKMQACSGLTGAIASETFWLTGNAKEWQDGVASVSPQLMVFTVCDLLPIDRRLIFYAIHGK